MYIDQNGQEPKKHSQKLLAFLISYDYFLPSWKPDCAGTPTIGYGHVPKEGEEYLLKEGYVITKEQAAELLENDLASFEKELNDNLESKKIKVNQQQFDALLSHYFNVGPYGTRSSRIWQDVIKGKVTVDSFVRENITAKKTRYLGLYRRRHDEWEIWATGDYQRDYPGQPEWWE